MSNLKQRISSWTLEQDEDCCGRVNSVIQSLTIEIADGGGGAYAVLKTDRWAADPDELRTLADAIEKAVKDHDAAVEEAEKRLKA